MEDFQKSHCNFANFFRKNLKNPLKYEDNDNVNSYNKDNESMDLDEDSNIDYFKRPLKEKLKKRSKQK